MILGLHPVTFWIVVAIVAVMLLAPATFVHWLTSWPAKYIEGLVSVPLVAIVTLCAAWRAGWVPSRWWAGLTALFGLLALGPFIHIAGINTYVPGPWAFLRYVPILGLTRSQ